MMWKMTGIVVLLLAVLLINLMLWRFAMPVYVNRRISRFQNELVNRHYDEVETMYRTMRGWRHGGGVFSLTSREITVSGCCGSMISWQNTADI